MHEKFFTKIYQLPMYNPSIDLMKKYSMAAIEDFGKHIFNNWVA
jgi:hypothetical protein